MIPEYDIVTAEMLQQIPRPDIVVPLKTLHDFIMLKLKPHASIRPWSCLILVKHAEIILFYLKRLNLMLNLSSHELVRAECFCN